MLIGMGIHPSSAAIASGAIGIMQVVGRMIFAAVEWRFSNRTMALGVFVLLDACSGHVTIGQFAMADHPFHRFIRHGDWHQYADTSFDRCRHIRHHILRAHQQFDGSSS